MATRDTNKSLDERCDNSVNITDKETGANNQSSQKGKTHQWMESIK